MAAVVMDADRPHNSRTAIGKEPALKIDDAAEMSAAFKSAMRRLAATVTIITARHGGRSFGMTATAVCSATTDPPSIVTCINRSASIHDPIEACGRFCINVLNCDHQGLVSIFSGKLTGEERFSNGRWSSSDNDIPYLSDAQASLFCTVAKSFGHGSHSVFVADVDKILLFGSTAPLLYQEGAFHRTVSLTKAV